MIMVDILGFCNYSFPMLNPSTACSLCEDAIPMSDIGKGLALLGSAGLECWRCLRDGVRPRQRVTRKSALDAEEEDEAA